MIAAERVIPSDVDVSAVLHSPHLIGCYGLRPVVQTKDYTCGAAAAATALRWMGKHGDEYDCVEALGTDPVVGTRWYRLVQLLRKRGLRAQGFARMPVQALIDRATDQLPTLVEWLDWGGHWVVHVGYEPRLKALVFADPAKPRAKFTCHSYETFERYWVAGGTGSMALTPAVAVTVDEWNKKAKVQDRQWPDDLTDGNAYLRYLYDWPTGKQWGSVYKRLDQEGKP